MPKKAYIYDVQELEELIGYKGIHEVLNDNCGEGVVNGIKSYYFETDSVADITFKEISDIEYLAMHLENANLKFENKYDDNTGSCFTIYIDTSW